MPFLIDYNAQLLRVTSPTVDVALQDLHDFVEDERGLASPEGLSRIAPPSVSPTGDPIFVVEGKIEDSAAPGNYSQILLVLISPWQIQFWAGSGYTRIFGGKISGGLNDQPMKATGQAGDITVLQSQLDGTYTLVETGVSGLTAAESAKLDSIPQMGVDIGLIQTDITTIEGDIGTILTNTTSAFRKNQPYPNFIFSMVDTTGQPVSGLTVAGERCLDSGAWSALTNACVEIGTSGVYRIDLTGADLNGDTVSLLFSAPGTVPRVITIATTG